MRIISRGRLHIWVISLLVAALSVTAFAQVVPVGSGSYTRTAPTGAALPQSTVYTTVDGPVPSHKFWTAKYWFPLGKTTEGGDYRINPKPLQASFTPQGLLMGIHSNIDGYPGNDSSAFAYFQYFNGDLTIGTAGLNVSQIDVAGSTDWTADFAWGSTMRITLGRGMPFAYVRTDGSAPTVTFARTPTVVTNNGNVLAVSTPEGDVNFTNYYGLFCPAGGNWVQNGSVFTCNAPAGHNYMSVALLPGNASALNTYAQYAFSFPTNTQATWNYNETTSQVSTTFTVTTEAMEGTETGFLMALYPHQYDSLPGGVNTPYTYITTRGQMRVLTGNSFTTLDTYHGILPFLPATPNYDNPTLSSYVNAVTGMPAGSLDTYAMGKAFNRVAQALPLAKAVGNNTAFTNLQNSIQASMQDWLTAANGEATNLFYYDNNWGSLIGYRGSYGSDNGLADHHFHYGYWVYTAALNGLYSPAWISNSQWGGMVDTLRQEYGNTDRSNPLFPFARNFDVYAGHSWASGIAGFGDGGNEESSSEAVNAWVGMILFGAATGNNDIRDAGIWLYTQETKAAAYYWFDQMPTKTFPAWFAPLAIANLFDAKSDVHTWFGDNPDYTHAIEYLPFTGGSLYLGFDPAYVHANREEARAQNISRGNPNGDWPDMMQMYEALYDADAAFTQWSATAQLFDGETKAHQYAWLKSLQALGHVDTTVTADTALYAVFNKAGVKTHVAFNPTNAPLLVTFSDGATLTVPAGSMSSELGDVTVGPGVGPEVIPEAPTALTAAPHSSTAINLSWTASATANVTYSVYRGDVSGFTPGTPVVSGLTATTYRDSGLTASTAYFYVVIAVNGAGNSDPSNEATATTNESGGGTTPGSDTLYALAGATTTAPGALSFTAGTAAASDVIPTNNGNQIDNAKDPITYVISGLNGTYDSSRPTTFHLYVDSGANVANGVQAQVRYDLDGNGTFDRSEQYSFFATNPVADWEDYNETARGGLQAGNTTGILDDMVNGTVEVRIWSALGTASSTLSVGSPTAGNQSAVVIPFTSVTQTVLPPEAPTNLSGTAASSAAVNLTWTASATMGVTYDVYRSETSGFTPAAANRIATGLTTTGYGDAGLNASTTYYYVVAAVNSAGAAMSTEASVQTLAGGAVAVANTLYVMDGATVATAGALSFAAGTAAASDEVPTNNGNFIDNMTNPLVYTVNNVSGTYDSTAVTQFRMFVDSGAYPANGVQVQVAYDLDGDRTFDRTEQYSFFATNDITNWEQYDQTSRGGLQVANTTGALGNMVNGTVVVRIWSALGTVSTELRTSASSADGEQSLVVLPFTNLTVTALPEPPTDVTAAAASYSQVDLSWTASTTAGSTYTVYRGTTAGFTPAVENELASGISGTTYADQTVAPSTTYYYVVAAVNGAGSSLSGEVSATTLDAPAATTTTINATPNPATLGTSVTFTATVTGEAPTGTVTFKDGSATLGTATLASGIATFTTSALTVGEHPVSAEYSGDAANAASTSAPLTEVITAVDFAIAAETNTATVTAGQSATYALTVTPQGSFADPITFTCSGLPSLAACSFNPASVTPGSEPATTTLTITTQAATTASASVPSNTGSNSLPIYAMISPIGLAALIVLGGKTRRNRVRRLLVSASALFILGMMVACGGDGGTRPTPPPVTRPGTPAGTSTITITATGGEVTHTTTVTLTVQ